MSGNSPYSSFEEASKEVLRFLQQRFGFALWMVTRAQCDDWIVLAAADRGYGVTAGNVYRWADSFCSRMVRGEGPRFAPLAMEIGVYQSAPIAQQLQIGAYIGVPLSHENGALFGTLCAIDPAPQATSLAEELPLVEVFGRLLGTVLRADLRAEEQARAAERAWAAALVDEMTSLFNRRGWDQLLEAEESRCARFGHSAAIAAIDLDSLKFVNDTYGHKAGDELIRRAAAAIRHSTRAEDLCARVGGDEFCVLLTQSDPRHHLAFESRVRQALQAADVCASVGIAARPACGTLADACCLADKRMYAEKSVHKAAAAG